jgi:predicted TIM-barrel fold metal-dependent hydrolase
MVKEAVANHGFCGIKVHRRDAVITREICETARAQSLPVLYDIMGEVAIIPTLASEYPDVTFIIPHLGIFNDDSRVQRRFIELLSRYPNIFTDTSGVRFFDQIKAAVYQAGAHKILFGTDGPWLHPEVEMEKIFAVKLSKSDEDNVLGGNILRLIAEPAGNVRHICADNFKSKRGSCIFA